MIDPSQQAKRQVCQVFDNCVDHYDTERGDLPYFQAQLALVLPMLAGESGRILDIGCAAGAEIRELRIRRFAVVGMDLVPGMLERARRRFEGDAHVQFCCADAQRLPFANQSMDHVVCLGVFEFLPDYASAVSEIHRVLRPGGLAISAVPSRISLYNLSYVLINSTIGLIWRALKSLFGRKAAVAGAAPSFRRNLCVPWRYRALLRRHGLKPEISRYSNFFIYPLDRFPGLNARVADALEPLCSVPLLRWAASVYLVSARKK